MADEPQQPEEVTPEEERAIILEKIREVLRYSLIETEEGVALDLDLLTRLLLQRAVPYRVLNRELSWAELQIVRDEQHVQRARLNADNNTEGERERAAERLNALVLRENEILDQLWPRHP